MWGVNAGLEARRLTASAPRSIDLQNAVRGPSERVGSLDSRPETLAPRSPRASDSAPFRAIAGARTVGRAPAHGSQPAPAPGWGCRRAGLRRGSLVRLPCVPARSRFAFAVLAPASAACRAESNGAETVDPGAFFQAVLHADRIVVLEQRRSDEPESPFRYDPVFETDRREDIESLAAAIRVRTPDAAFRCLCIATQKIELVSQGGEAATIWLNGVRSLSFSTWNSNASLVDPELLLDWFDAHGVTEPRIAWDEDRADAARWREQRARWVAAMPSSLRDLEPKLDEWEIHPAVSDLRDAPIASARCSRGSATAKPGARIRSVRAGPGAPPARSADRGAGRGAASRAALRASHAGRGAILQRLEIPRSTGCGR